MKYGLLGDGVNLTARLKGLTSRYQVRTIASEAVRENEICAERLLLRPLDKVAVKGKTEPTTVYDLLGQRTHGDARDAAQLAQAASAPAQAMALYHCRKFGEATVLFVQA